MVVRAGSSQDPPAEGTVDPEESQNLEQDLQEDSVTQTIGWDYTQGVPGTPRKS